MSEGKYPSKFSKSCGDYCVYYPSKPVVNNNALLFWSNKCTFYINLSSRTLECHILLIIYCMTHVHVRTSGSFHLRSRIYKLTLSSPEHAPAYMMAANAGVYHTVHVIQAITISLIVIGLKTSYSPLIHLSGCYRTVCYRTPCYRTVQ